ncbi:hypothetical protein DFH07DRAFT_960983 [Mycena maculata]|uniref:Uncharacterized protein n=1 Tax=Mycena maculata TaxID=230809 RepID=A0AAD7IV57_9AGAR|nr:hypothetical protein DFH07DRAFT_960983 [Mycena maculata]
MDPPKRKVTVKVTEPSPQRNYVSRSPSPYKPSPSPTFRPKAKVNSSATTNLVARKATSTISSSTSLSKAASVKSTASSTGRSLTPRSGSPSKQPSTVPRARAALTRGVTVRPAGTQDPRRRSLTGESSASRTPASAAVSVSDILDLSDDESPVPSPRITAKLSGSAKQDSGEFPQSPTLPPNSSLRAHSHRARVPSISSNASSSSSPFYPGTAAAAAASSPPHRYSSGRPNPPSGAQSPGPHFYQPFPREDSPKYSARVNGGARVDPAAIPLPPHSPPTSAVSFSSRSSLSLSGPSSTGYVTESGTSQLGAQRPTNGNARRESADANMRSGLAQLMNMAEEAGEDDGADASTDSADECEAPASPEQLRASTMERKVRAEAKSVRKIADLEITNRSLLAINTTLEQTKHRQAKELRELRRKLRESRLILPPRAFRAVKSSLDHDDTADEDDEDQDEEEDAEMEGKGEQDDATYRRVKALIDGLLEGGRRALETTPRDFPEPPKVAKVLSAYEVPQPYLSDDDEHQPRPRAPPSPAPVAVPDSDGEGESFASEDEVEAMTLPRDSPPPSPPPSPAPPSTQ